MSPLSELRDKLETLNKAFARRLGDRVRSMVLAVEKLQANEDPTSILDPIRRELHSLAGSCATFGLPEAGAESRRLEKMVEALLQDNTPLEKRKKKSLQSGLQSLKTLV